MKLWHVRVHDDRGNGFTVKELAKMYSISTTYVNELVRGSGITTLMEMSGRWRELAMNRKPTVYITDAHGNKFKLNTIGERLGRSRSWVMKVRRTHGCKTIEEFEDYLKNPLPLRKFGHRKKVVKAVEFSRGKHCFRDDFMVECKNYSSCADARIAGAHHSRYREDGSCFVAEKRRGVYED